MDPYIKLPFDKNVDPNVIWKSLNNQSEESTSTTNLDDVILKITDLKACKELKDIIISSIIPIQNDME